MTEPNTRPLSDEQRHLAEIEALQRDYDQAEAEWDQAKENAAALKKIAEAKAKKLFEFIRALGAPLPLFEVWKQTPVAELGLPDGIVAILCEAGYDTVGKLAELSNRGIELTSIPHIGEQKAEAIRAALERFWQGRKADGEL
jgi:hypothetical protein